ncbi:MAG: DUF1552 domain-containing protein [Rhodospirillaceae bacterium]|jgi:hypothetical protein|nr:DUF1552 domain-containing protein [Rhodospirillaceae bacterium]MBT5566060.1 DUF1552 domain-containing protein [Rhodospirillaceae bacterium]MBT6090026.1 DUF1552 domain-containing protein [Rhodospirillaceae bacterium]MBT6959734.1 DUF1552 domain-containing protein [Rhodospirillaceae bacterium]MBT7449287.1 DUF1552 domain-containing protein [Rhodospirillaceae bacterium]
MTLNRRSFLRGTAAGSAVAVGLPFLDCFLNDSGTALASGAPIPLRFGSWFWGLGHTPGRGIAMDGKPEITFLEETQPLAPYVNDLNYFNAFNTPLDGRPSAVHFSGWVAAKTGTVPRTFGDTPEPTLDVIIADHIGASTRFRSLDLSATGSARDSYTFRNSTSRNAADVSPLAFYQRVFGPGFVDPNQADFTPAPSVMVRSSVLSAVHEESKDFLRTLGASDRARMDEYFTSIRQLENQLALQMEKPDVSEACGIPTPPPEDEVLGIEIEVAQRNHKLLTDILVMALACNQTRVFNMLYSQALSLLRRRGESFTHHTLTHEEPIDASLGYQREVAELHVTSMKALAVFIQAFKDIREGDGTLLDNTLIFANSDTGNSRVHSVDNIPVMMIGNAGGRLKTGMHIAGNGDPITRIGLTALQVMGVPIERWGTGSLETTKTISQVLV